MKIYIKRKEEMEHDTIGELLIDGRYMCDTLEPGRGLRIPQGCYRVTMRYSPHFKSLRPWLHDVPGRQWILIHEGNTHKDTKGCILVGKSVPQKKMGRIYNSRKTLSQLMEKIRQSEKLGEVVMLQVV